ncbi:MAG: tetratricopeptide repeat protein [Alphaproteobacteria bacterium]|nr:tetratricopeptide repeat protein [Alphaproteobacteria bacterium]
MLQAALALQQWGDFKEARRKYESIIARDPRNFNALELCGVEAIQQEAYRDAVQLLRRALALRSNDAPVLTNFGIAHQKLGQTADALECFDKAIASKPDFASAHHNRANVLREAKRLKGSTRKLSSRHHAATGQLPYSCQSCFGA